MAEKKPTTTNKTQTDTKEINGAKQQISTRTIVIITAIIVALVVVIIFVYKWQETKNHMKLDTSYLIDSGTISLEIKNLDEVNQILSEPPTEYFVLITYTGNENAYGLEHGLKSIIDDYKLNDSFYYLNVENIKDEDNYITRINKTFNTDIIEKVPTILYYKDGKLVDSVKRTDNNCINAGDFQKLLDIYEYEGQ